MNSLKHFGKVAAATIALGAASQAFAGAVITSGDIALGVNDQGNLNFSGGLLPANASAMGIAIKDAAGAYRDATAPGCLCEGWGVSASGVSGWANVAGGSAGLVTDSFTSTATTATSTVHLGANPDLVVKQEYFPAPEAPGALFQDKVTITNNGAVDLTNLRYVRVMDWDIPPTEFNEWVTIKGTGTTTFLELSHDDGFETSDPLAFTDALNAGTTNVDFEDVHGASTVDHGAYFKFNFGTLKAGESRTFSVYYGAAYSEASMLASLGSVGIELYSLGQSNTTGGPTLGTPYTFAFGFKGVGGTVILPNPTGVPEPSTYGMIGAGVLAGLIVLRRRFGKKA